MFFCKNNDKGIMSLAVIFVIGFFGLGLVLTVATAALLGITKNYNTNSGNQTFYTAETAVREGIYQYLADNSYSTGNFSQTINNISTSSIPISVTSSWPYVIITGEAENNITHREVGYILNVFPEGLAFDYAVYSENTLDLGGSVDVEGNIFANGTTSISGSATIDGDAFSAATVTTTGSGDVTGNESSFVDPIPPPQIDLEEYRSIATFEATSSPDAQGYLNGNTITGEIIFVDATTTETDIQTTNLTGSLAVKGDLRLRGGTVITATDNYAAVVVNGDLRITGNTTINGVVYVSGNTTFSGGNNFINGSLISVDGVDTELLGSVDIQFSTSTLLFGISTTTTSTPKITSWQEQ